MGRTWLTEEIKQELGVSRVWIGRERAASLASQHLVFIFRVMSSHQPGFGQEDVRSTLHFRKISPRLKRERMIGNKSHNEETRERAGRGFHRKIMVDVARGHRRMQRGDGLRGDYGGSPARCDKGPDVQVREEGGQGTLKYGMWATGRIN